MACVCVCVCHVFVKICHWQSKAMNFIDISISFDTHTHKGKYNNNGNVAIRSVSYSRCVSLFYVTGVVCIELFSVDLFAHSATFFEWFHISIEFFCGCNSILVSSIAASITGIQVHRTGYFDPFSLISVQIVCQTLE